MQKKTFSTKQMAMDAVLAAVCAVLGYFGPDLGNLKITFEGLPVIVAALLFRPLDGAAVGGIAGAVLSNMKPTRRARGRKLPQSA